MSEKSLGEARQEYFSANGLPPDGGYELTWVPLMFGSFRLYLYNARSRKRAVPLHDLHHIVTGYGTDPIGEAEIAAWELAAGTHDKYFAFLINLPALLYGTVLAPRRLFRAYALGRGSATFYSRDMEEDLLDLTVADARKQLLPAVAPSPTLSSLPGFMAFFALALGLFTGPIILLILA